MAADITACRVTVVSSATSGAERGREGVERGSRGGREGVERGLICRSSPDARKPQNPTRSEEYRRYLQGVLYST
eukprot:134241-Prorocentrum_minimum.AAC.1